MSKYSNFSDSVIDRKIYELEYLGYTGRTDPELHNLNVEQNTRLSDSELRSRISSRISEGKTTLKLRREADRRGLS